MSVRTIVYRAYAESYKKLVILKLPNHPYPSFQELTKYRNAHALVKNLKFPGLVKILVSYITIWIVLSKVALLILILI